MNISSTIQYPIVAAGSFLSVLAAGSIRRSRAPTPLYAALAAIQATATTLIYGALRFVERKFGIIDEKEIDSPKVVFANYLIAQTVGFAVSYLAIAVLKRYGFNIQYDMNPPAIDYDPGNYFCVAGQTTLVSIAPPGIYFIVEAIRKKFSSAAGAA